MFICKRLLLSRVSMYPRPSDMLYTSGAFPSMSVYWRHDLHPKWAEAKPSIHIWLMDVLHPALTDKVVIDQSSAEQSEGSEGLQRNKFWVIVRHQFLFCLSYPAQVAMPGSFV